MGYHHFNHGDAVQVRDQRDMQIAIKKAVFDCYEDGAAFVVCDASEPTIGGMRIGVPVRCVEALGQ